MTDIIKYKGYTGSVEFSSDDNLYYGKVQGIKSLISYEGKTIDLLIEDFQKAINLYEEVLYGLSNSER